MGIRARRARRRAEWEGICNRCGLCCYDRKRVLGRGVVILWRRPCPFLHISSGLCKATPGVDPRAVEQLFNTYKGGLIAA